GGAADGRGLLSIPAFYGAGERKAAPRLQARALIQLYAGVLHHLAPGDDLAPDELGEFGARVRARLDAGGGEAPAHLGRSQHTGHFLLRFVDDGLRRAARIDEPVPDIERIAR